MDNQTILDTIAASPVGRIIEALEPYLEPGEVTEENVLQARLKAVAAGAITDAEIDALAAEADALAAKVVQP